MRYFKKGYFKLGYFRRSYFVGIGDLIRFINAHFRVIAKERPQNITKQRSPEVIINKKDTNVKSPPIQNEIRG